MSLTVQIFKSASWLAFFKLISQIFSWTTTIIIARVLAPADYGLLEMSFMFAGYAMIFSELGLGSAIIHRAEPTNKELSSVFWFSATIGILLGLACFLFAYPNSLIFNEPRVIPLTQAVSLIFLLSALQVVPLNLLKKEMNFKRVGFIQMSSTFFSCVAMIVLVYMGAGVWTLLLGSIIRKIITLFQAFLSVNWTPKWHFNFSEAKAYLSFGITVAGSRSLFYIYEMSDKFFAGRAWSAQMLGYYSFAFQLAQLPTEKIAVLINQVSFSAFSKLQNDKAEFNKLYIQIVYITATIVTPLFFGGFLVSDELIRVFLNDKWFPIIPLFKYLCIVQIITGINAVNNFVHIAQGRPQWSFCCNAVLAIAMPISFYFAVQYGLNAILIPWFTVYMAICLIWIVITLKKIEVPLFKYLRTINTPIIGSLVMSVPVFGIGRILSVYLGMQNPVLMLSIKIFTGAATYLLYLYVFDKEAFRILGKLRRSKTRKSMI